MRSQKGHCWLDGTQLCEARESALRHRSRHKRKAIVQRLVLGLAEKGGESVLLEGLGGNENIRGNGKADVRIQRGGLQTQETGGKEKKGLRDGLKESKAEVAVSVDTEVVAGVQRAARKRADAGECEGEETGEPLGEKGGYYDGGGRGVGRMVMLRRERIRRRLRTVMKRRVLLLRKASMPKMNTRMPTARRSAPMRIIWSVIGVLRLSFTLMRVQFSS